MSQAKKCPHCNQDMPELTPEQMKQRIDQLEAELARERSKRFSEEALERKRRRDEEKADEWERFPWKRPQIWWGIDMASPTYRSRTVTLS